MLIRNAMLDGYSGLVDLRLMHGAVQEIGVGLMKGLYESEIDFAGDVLRPVPAGMTLPAKYRRTGAGEAYIRPGSREPFQRWRDGVAGCLIHQHSGD